MAQREKKTSLTPVQEQRKQREDVQQPHDAADRIAQVLALYIEYQSARPAQRAITLHEQFMKLNPPEFIGTTDPLVAEEWLKKLEAIFEVMAVTDEHRLLLAVFMLRGEARNWWEATRRMMGFPVPITWQQFIQVFNDQYFPLIYKYQKEQEFISLT